jgi:hypothetical protein
LADDNYISPHSQFRRILTGLCEFCMKMPAIINEEYNFVLVVS